MNRLQHILHNANHSIGVLQQLHDDMINNVLCAIADKTLVEIPYLLNENKKDLDRMDRNDPKYDRLQLTEQRLHDIASDLRHVAGLPSPVGRLLEETTRPNGLIIKKISVPFGIIGVIYEARPNVSFDVFSLCFKSGNVCLLKGGHDAYNSNNAIVTLIRNVLDSFGIDPDVVSLLPADRETTMELLNAVGKVDLIIPRGSQGLIDFVRNNARVPVIETGAGICHTYFDQSGDLQKGTAIVNNAKTRRVSVCNALDCLIIHALRLHDLPLLCAPLKEHRVILFADDAAYEALSGKYPEELLQHATEKEYGTEFLDYKMAVKTVKTLDGALEHIARYGSKHSEAIISEDTQAVSRFQKEVDAACVYANASTAFTDGGQFGFGAEIGISTQKMHARGPMALREMTTYKWIISGNGQVR